MKNDLEQTWIAIGYELFAHEGLAGLNIERMSRIAYKSKSSFYHLFADIELFQEKLLRYHQQRGIDIAQAISLCPNINPAMIDLLLSVKTDILFHRQLRIYRNNSQYRQCFIAAHAPVEAAIMPFWAALMGLPHNTYVARLILNLSIDNFYLRVTNETLNREWLLGVLHEWQHFVSQLKNDIRIEA